VELPVCVVDFDDISELKRSMADDAAPMANNMAILQQGRAWRLKRLPKAQQAACHGKNPINPGLGASMQVPRTRQELPPAAEFSGSEVPSARIARHASAC